mgnify:CR=1 FL=1
MNDYKLDTRNHVEKIKDYALSVGYHDCYVDSRLNSFYELYHEIIKIIDGNESAALQYIKTIGVTRTIHTVNVYISRRGIVYVNVTNDNDNFIELTEKVGHTDVSNLIW